MDAKQETRFEFAGAAIAIALLLILGVVGLLLWSGLFGALIAITFAVVALIIAIVAWSNRRQRPAADAPRAATVTDGRMRFLVVADHTCRSPALVQELKGYTAGRSALVFVIAPALETRVGQLTNDQSGFDHGATTLAETLDKLRAAGLEADGEVGSPDPLQAADDGLRQFAADEIVFVTGSGKDVNWLEQGVVAAAKARFDRPVAHVVASD